MDGNVLRVMTRFLADATPLERPALRRDYPSFSDGLSGGAVRCIYPEPDGAGGARLPAQRRAAVRPVPPPGDLPSQCGRQPLRISSPRAKGCQACRGADGICFLLRRSASTGKRPPEGPRFCRPAATRRAGKLSVAQAIAQAEQWGVRPRQLEKSVERQHILTHITWRMTAYYFQCGAAPAAFIGSAV